MRVCLHGSPKVVETLESVSQMTVGSRRHNEWPLWSLKVMKTSGSARIGHLMVIETFEWGRFGHWVVIETSNKGHICHLLVIEKSDELFSIQKGHLDLL